MRNRNPAEKLVDLYERDETAWLEQSVALIQRGEFDELDYTNLIDCLDALANSQRREVGRRLRILLFLLLKWEFQPTERSRRWLAMITHQRQELNDILSSSSTLSRHAVEVLAEGYAGAVKLASVETDLAASRFPERCPFSVNYLISDQLPGSDESE